MMMVKKISLMLLVIAMILCCSGCGAGQSSIVGTWYSDRDDRATLTLGKDGTYSDGTWLMGGKYTIDGDTVSMNSVLDGDTTLLLKEQDGQTVLFFDSGNYSHTYYSTEEQATAVREARIADAEAEQKDWEENIVENTVNVLVGEWIGGTFGRTWDGGTIDSQEYDYHSLVFTESTCTVRTNIGTDYESTFTYEYKVLNDRQMEITQDGRTYTASYQLKKDEYGVTSSVKTVRDQWSLEPPVWAQSGVFYKPVSGDNSGGVSITAP